MNDIFVDEFMASVFEIIPEEYLKTIKDKLVKHALQRYSN